MTVRVLPLLAAAVLSVVAATPALAQSKTSDVSADRANAAKITLEENPGRDKTGAADESRVDESYEPKGVELGQFLLLPALEFAQSYNSNVFATKNDVRDDQISRVQAKARLRSRFREHELNAGAEIEQFAYWKYTDDNHLNAQAYFDGRYDFSKNWEARGSFLAYKQTEDRGSPDDAGGVEPTPLYGATSTLGTRWSEGRFTYGISGRVDRRIFMDVETSTGTDINNSDRDRWEYETTGRGEYEMFPGYSVVAQMSANTRQYDSKFDDAGFERSSYGFQAFSGFAVDITQLIKGDFLIGYLHQDYNDSRLTDPSGPALKASFNWSPTRLTLIVPSFERSVLETTTTSSSSIVSSSASILVRHELQRNVILTGYVGATYNEFEGIGREDATYEARARFLWALAPEYYVGGELGYRLRDSTVKTSNYDQTVGILRFGLRM